MFCLATKYQCARHNIYTSVRNNSPFVNVLKIPTIFAKNFAGQGVCGGGCGGKQGGENPCTPSATKSGGDGSSRNKISFKAYVKPKYLPHDYKNMRLRRPMSPHLLVYAPTLPAMTSIGQRITGTITTFFALLLSGGALFLSNGVDSYISAIQSLDLSRFSILIVKLLLGAPFAFHYLNGIRFVAFNTGRWLTKKEVYATAQKVIIGAAIISVVFALI